MIIEDYALISRKDRGTHSNVRPKPSLVNEVDRKAVVSTENKPPFKRDFVDGVTHEGDISKIDLLTRQML